MIIHGRSLTSHSFAGALHAALRVLVDDLECPSFNAAVGGMTHQAVDTRPLTNRHDKTDQRAVRQGYCLAADMRNQYLQVEPMWDAATRASNARQPFSGCKVVARC